MISTKDKIKIFQKALGSLPDGIPGASTWDSAYRYLESQGLIEIEFPYSDIQFGCKVMFTKPNRVRLIDAEGLHSVREYDYSISGTFTAPSGVKPCSFMISDGEAMWGRACHANTWDGQKGETILYCKSDGTIGTQSARVESEVKGLMVMLWGIGGGAMIPEFKFEEEGFVGRFADVKRYTAHNGLGFDKYGNVVGVYHPQCTLEDFRRRCLSIGMVLGIFIDGGHIAAINAGDLRANTYQKQGSIICF